MKAEIEKLLKSEGYILHVWHKNDILSKAKDMGVKLTKSQLDRIATELEHVDCNFGINWDTIEDYISDITGG